MNREINIKKLIDACKKLSERRDLSRQKTDDLQMMARLAKAGKKDSEEFNTLQGKWPANQVIDFSAPIEEICRIVKKIKP